MRCFAGLASLLLLAASSAAQTPDSLAADSLRETKATPSASTMRAGILYPAEVHPAGTAQVGVHGFAPTVAVTVLPGISVHGTLFYTDAWLGVRGAVPLGPSAAVAVGLERTFSLLGRDMDIPIQHMSATLTLRPGAARVSLGYAHPLGPSDDRMPPYAFGGVDAPLTRSTRMFVEGAAWRPTENQTPGSTEGVVVLGLADADGWRYGVVVVGKEDDFAWTPYLGYQRAMRLSGRARASSRPDSSSVVAAPVSAGTVLLPYAPLPGRLVVAIDDLFLTSATWRFGSGTEATFTAPAPIWLLYGIAQALQEAEPFPTLGAALDVTHYERVGPLHASASVGAAWRLSGLRDLYDAYVTESQYDQNALGRRVRGHVAVGTASPRGGAWLRAGATRSLGAVERSAAHGGGGGYMPIGRGWRLGGELVRFVWIENPYDPTTTNPAPGWVASWFVQRARMHRRRPDVLTLGTNVLVAENLGWFTPVLPVPFVSVTFPILP